MEFGTGSQNRGFRDLLKGRPGPTGKMDKRQSSQSLGVHSPDNSSRSSFSSVRENDSDLAQAFTSTKVSSYARHSEEAVEDQPSPPTEMSTTVTQFLPPVTQPHSRLHGCWLPAVAADGFRGWKQIDVKGKIASKSYGDLQALRVVWSPPATPPSRPKDSGRAAPGQAPIERLPLELLNPIIDLLVLDVPPNGLSARNVDLMSLLLTSKTLHAATLNALYRNITIPHSRIFRKFLTHVLENKELGTIVRRIDFSHFNPMTLFSTASERATTRNLTPESLLQCLELTPYLREFLAQEYIDDEMNVDVLRKLFFGLERLEAIDFCGCSSTKFRESFEAVIKMDWPDRLSLSRVSLHRCITLPASVFQTLLPRLGNLTHLDVAGTRITDEALQSIPHTARITHLNLSKCKLLSADVVIDFLTNHPAVKSLVYLNLAEDARSHQLFDEADVSRLLPILPPTLRSLSLIGSVMESSHIDLLRPLTKHLEELALGRRLKIRDIHRLFVPDEPDTDAMDTDENPAENWVPHTLKYLDLSDYTAAELQLSELFSSTCSITSWHSAPLEVLEVPDTLYGLLSKSRTVQQSGWRVTEFGSRAWLVRQQGRDRQPGDGPRDSGIRSWKMGASFWGMRKVPVAVTEVGGMYGSYMFKRKL
ncbi:hypothetical protein DL771_002947 [Monosporascus sp. 5C6A]|nr:hypothetical protein DL771_002947 [Monosporascus sp. 5C6A]